MDPLTESQLAGLDRMEKEVDRVLARWADPNLPSLGETPIVSFGVPKRIKEVLGIPCVCHSARQGWLVLVDANALKAAIEYHRTEFTVRNEDG